MKKAISLGLTVAMLLTLCACGGKDGGAGKEADPDQKPAATETAAPTPTPTPEPQKKAMGTAEFDELLAGLPLTVEQTQYVVQDDNYKSLYPDMLQAVIRNQTTADIKDAVIAFVAWDANELPVKIIGSMDFNGGAYIKQVNYGDINLVGGATYGEDSGFSVDETCGIAHFNAIPVSFVTFEGEKWENPYYSDWKKLYEGVKYTADLSVEVQLKDAGFEAAEKDAPGAEGKTAVSEESLAAELSGQPLKVVSAQYVVQDETYKSLYPDMMQAELENTSQTDIKDAVIAFAAWDANGLPVKIKGSLDFNDGTYVKQVNFADINLVAGGTFGDGYGYQVDEKCGIVTVKAIAVSYETFEGDTWENDCFNDWCALYEGQKLAQ